MPKWIDDLTVKFHSNIASVFILHGNTLDHIPKVKKDEANRGYFRDPIEMLGAYMGDREILITYDRVKGFSFPPIGDTRGEEYAKEILSPRDTNDRFAAPVAAANIREFNWGNLKEPKKALPALRQILTSKSKPTEDGMDVYDVGVIIDYAESIFSSDSWKADDVDELVTQILQWAVHPEMRNANSMVVLVCRDQYEKLHPALRNLEAKIEPIMIPYPSHTERAEFLDYFLQRDEDLRAQLQKDKDTEPDIQMLANVTAGLSYAMVEDCLLRAYNEQSLDPIFIKERKDEVVRARYNDVIELAEPVNGWDTIGGCQELKEFFIRDVCEPLKSGDRHRVPMGVLMGGAPGTGKSIFAEAVALHAGVLFITWRFSKIFSKWVGDSERNMEKVLYATKSMSPCIVFIDEIDQAGHRRGQEQSDSGVGSRIFQRLLEFMSDSSNRGKVCFLAATNRPDLLDPAIKRAGRFDNKVAFFPPDRADRGDIVKAVCQKNSLILKGDITDHFLDNTENYVGADLEVMVLRARDLVEDDAKARGKKMRRTVTAASLDQIVNVIRPSVPVDVIRSMTELAMQEVNDIRILPKKYRDMYKQGGFRVVK